MLRRFATAPRTADEGSAPHCQGLHFKQRKPLVGHTRFIAFHDLLNTYHTSAHFCEKLYKLTPLYFYSKSRDSVVGIATGYGLDHRGFGVRVPVGSRILSSPRRLDWLGPTQPPIESVPGALSLGVNQQGLVAGHSPPIWISTSTPPYAFMAWCLIN
jgi:hypothetical protein